ncbi:XRE family transcriptional regulator [Paenalcaligenes niemegkensis]|uniref:helix-turn-helix domain-containing protein n=1 Tax=Paenalcaligenes niemegkensis TaxID=2895469 RepID=UPI001EE83280|nr:XRE family transcriptional regulator [Paenalcaligenes niemegkensis]MCQ9615921.1 XRE family transcriptional regulator [Paenalcaligenes niemegkensis]
MNTPLSKRIELLLHEKRWSAAELARQAKVSRAAVTDWRNGNVNNISLDVAVRIGRAAKIDPMWIATGEGTPLPGYVAQEDGLVEWPFPSVSLDDIKRLSDSDRRDLETTIKRFVAGCLAQQNESS